MPRPRTAKISLAIFALFFLLTVWSMGTPVIMYGSGWRFGLIEATVGFDTWDPALVPANMRAAGGWYMHAVVTGAPPLGWYGSGTMTFSGRYVYVSALPLVAAPLPVSIVFWSRKRRPRSGHCPACGYDRGRLSPEVACPECGQPPQSPHS